MSEASSSQRSGSSFTGASSAASSTDLAKETALLSRDRNESGDDADLLDANHTIQDGVFSCMYLLTKGRQGTSLRNAILQLLLEFLQLFLLVFNPTFELWHIKEDLWFWKGIRWVLFRLVVYKKGYGMFIKIFYVVGGTIVSSAGLTVWSAFLLRKDSDGNIWTTRLIATLQWVSYLVYRVAFVSVLDYVTFMFDCNYTNLKEAHHRFYVQQDCLAMPHLGHSAFAAIVLITYVFFGSLLAAGGCDPNPVSKDYLSSSNARAILNMVLIKAVLTVCATCVDTNPQLQAIFITLGCTAALYCQLREFPQYRQLVNHLWAGLWSSLTYTSFLLLLSSYNKKRHDVDFLEQSTQYVLYGAFPIFLGGMGASYLWWRAITKKVERFRRADRGAQAKDIYRFTRPEEVGLLCRVMRKWDLDGEPDPKASELGEFIIKCGNNFFKLKPSLLILHANYLLAVKHDSTSARTQAQTASKNSPTLVDRYFIYVTQEQTKKLRGSSDGIMDLMGFVEFQRNYRACVRCHKMCLQAQRFFWQALLKDTVKFQHLQRVFALMDKSEKQASAMYKRVMDRYPNSGKLLKAYGHFLEYVKNDPWSASRFYSEAVKVGLTESLLNVTGGSDGEGTQSSIFTSVDEKTDGIIIINAVGTVLMLNQSAYKMFGYERGELEGKNVSVLMPPPFSTNHNSYLQKYAQTGEEHIINQIRPLVGMQKDRTIFPIRLGVTRLSGIGAEAVFMGVCKPVDNQSARINVWVSPGGTMVCVDQRFADWFGYHSEELIGREVKTIAERPEVFVKLLQDLVNVPAEALEEGKVKLTTKITHKYIEALQVEVVIELGGTASQRLYIFSLKRTIESLPLMAVDHKGKMTYATTDLANMLGYTAKNLTDLSLMDLVPQPFGQLHQHWIKEMPLKMSPASCRAGHVVHMVSSTNKVVPVTLQLSQHDSGGHVEHVVKVTPSNTDVYLDQQRLVLKVDEQGTIIEVNIGASKELFGFHPKQVVGHNIGDVVPLLKSWISKTPGLDMPSAMGILLDYVMEHPGASWRVGVLNPTAGQDTRKFGGGNWTSMRDDDKEGKAAILQLEPLKELDEDEGGPLTVTVLLWRADMMGGVIELDRSLTITKVDSSVGVLLGKVHHALVRQSLNRVLRLPPGFMAKDLLHLGTKKGAMRGGGAWRLGLPKEYACLHADGQPLSLMVQAVSKDSASAVKMAARLQVNHTNRGSVAVFQALLDKPEEAIKVLEDAVKVPDLMRGPPMVERQSALLDVGSLSSSSSGTPERTDVESQSEGRSVRGDKSLPREDSSRRTADWVQAVSHMAPGSPKPIAGKVNGEPEVARGAMAMPPRYGSPQPVTLVKAAEAAGSVASGSEAGGASEDGGTSDMNTTKDEDITADFRRARRLKKLLRMMTSHQAQASTIRFYRHTWGLLALMFLVHLTCFVALIMQIDHQHQYVYKVDMMAKATDVGQLIGVRARILQKCPLPRYETAPVCQQGALEVFHSRQQRNAKNLRAWHHELYLGKSGKKPKSFADPEIYSIWTDPLLDELHWSDSANRSVAVQKAGLWQIGNNLVYAAEEVVHWWPQLKHRLNETRPYNYILLNSQESFFQGYSDSLDLEVAFAWTALSGLFTVLVVLLVVEACVVQLSCALYQYLLLMLVNSQHTRHFSIFLMLPSGALRMMASKTVKVDEDDIDDLDDEEVDDIGGGGPTNAGDVQEVATQGSEAEDRAPPKQERPKRQVRMSLDIPPQSGDQDVPNPPQEQNGEGDEALPVVQVHIDQQQASPRVLKKAKGQKARKSGWNLIARSFRFPRTYRINGKKLEASNTIVMIFMAPILLWVAANIVIYGVSYEKLGGMQGPLASLNSSSRVVYLVSRVRFLANLLVFAENTAEYNEYRESLHEETKLLQSEYNSLLYGGYSMLDKQSGKRGFNRPAPVGVFMLKSVADLFFRTRSCLCEEPADCKSEDNPYYEVTHSGLDAMLQRFIEEMLLLAEDPESAIGPNNPRYDYNRQVAGLDLYDGIKAAAQLFANFAIGQYDQVKTFHIILLVLTIADLLLYIVILFRPYTKRVYTESAKVAGLLSTLPPETDVEGMVKQVLLEELRKDK